MIVTGKNFNLLWGQCNIFVGTMTKCRGGGGGVGGQCKSCMQDHVKVLWRKIRCSGGQ